MKVSTHAKLVSLELISGVLGWVWIFASLATVYCLIAAVFFHAPWSHLWWTLGTAVIAKWLARGFIDNQERVAFEADLVAKGYSPEDAGREWMRRYMKS